VNLTRDLVQAAQPTVKNLINGEFMESSASSWIDVTNPARPQEPYAHTQISTRPPMLHGILQDRDQHMMFQHHDRPKKHLIPLAD